MKDTMKLGWLDVGTTFEIAGLENNYRNLKVKIVSDSSVVITGEKKDTEGNWMQIPTAYSVSPDTMVRITTPKQKIATAPVEKPVSIADALPKQVQVSYNYHYPEGEFTIKQLSEKWGNMNLAIVGKIVNTALEKGEIRLTRKAKTVTGKGKPARFFEKV